MLRCSGAAGSKASILWAVILTTGSSANDSANSSNASNSTPAPTQEVISGCTVQADQFINAYPCAEGNFLPIGSTCTALCLPGHVLAGPEDGYDVYISGGLSPTCMNTGRLDPPGTACRPWRCFLPYSGSLWTATVPSGRLDDYAAESECISEAPDAQKGENDGRGCPTCYGPPVQVEATPEFGIDVGNAAVVVLRFEAQRGRHLLFAPGIEVQVHWGQRRSSASTGLTNVTTTTLSAYDLVISEQPKGGPSMTDLEQLDSGPMRGSSGLEVVQSEAVMKEPLVRPPGTQVVTSVRMAFRYVIAGCRHQLEGVGSVKIDVEVRSSSYNLTTCEAQVASWSVERGLEGCSPSCLPHFRGLPRATCPQDGGIFELEGCYSDCPAPKSYNPQSDPDGIFRAMTPSCSQGPWVEHGAICFPRCQATWTATESTLHCDDGVMSPAGFQCSADCDAAGLVGRRIAAVPCEELRSVNSLGHGGICTPVCVDGYHPVPLKPLSCANGALSPESFVCHPLFAPAAELPNPGARRSTWWRVSYDVVYAAVASTAREGQPDQSVIHKLQRVVDGRGRWQIRKSLPLGYAADSVAVVAIDPSEELAPRRLLILTGSDAGAVFELGEEEDLTRPVQRILDDTGDVDGTRNISGNAVEEELVEDESFGFNSQLLHRFDTAGAGQRMAATYVNGRLMLIMASESANASVFAWNGSFLLEEHSLGMPAVAVVPFETDSSHFVFALSGVVPSRIYQFVAANPSDNVVNASDNVVNAFGTFQPRLSFQFPSASAATWLGCSNDLMFVNQRGQPCHTIDPSECITDITVRLACAALCGCVHGAPLLAVAVAYPDSHVLVLRVDNSGSTLEQIAKAPVDGPVYDLCTVFVPAHDALYLAAAVGPPPGQETASSALFRVFSGGRLEFVQNFELLSGSTSPVAATNCAALQGQNTSLLYLGTSPDFGAPTDSALQPEHVPSRLFAAEGWYDWVVSGWGACDADCVDDYKVESVRTRTVTCSSWPSGIVYNGSFCPDTAPATEETCKVPRCLEDRYQWNYDEWGDCDGECGQGAHYRQVHCERVDTLGESVDPENCDSKPRPVSLKPCTLSHCTSYRLVNRVAVKQRWQVVELGFYFDDTCTNLVQGTPFSSGHCEECQCQNATGFWGHCEASLAFDGHSIADTFANTGTAWNSKCGTDVSCGPGHAWLGVHSNEIGELRCIKLFQSGDVDYLSREVALEKWEHKTARWQTVAEWANVGGGRWERLEVPRLCSDELDCKGNGIAQGLPGSCGCKCDQGYRGASCDYCAPGYDGYPLCKTRPVESYAWRLVALSAAPTGHWHVADLSLHTGLECDTATRVPVEQYSEFLFFDEINGANTVLANDTLGPFRSFDESGERTAWATPCGGGSTCANDAWLGVKLHNETRVRCAILHQGVSGFAVDTVALDLWVNETTSWERVRQWSRLIRRGEENGAAMDVATGPIPLKLHCDESIPVGQMIATNCGESGLQPWDECTAWCKAGFSGTEVAFVCQDDYSFTGLQPECEPKQCTGGMPVTNAVVADDCVGRVTEETCTVTCIDGFVGDPVTYVCGQDGYLQESRSRQIGVVPSCRTSSIFNEAVETTSASVHASVGGWSVATCVSFFVSAIVVCPIA